MSKTYESSITRHLILYSKGHYPKSNNILEDLKTLFSNYSGTPRSYYTDKTIYSFVSESFVDSCTKQDCKEILKCFYRKPFSQEEGPATLEEMVSYMIGMMACIQIKEKEGDNWVTLVELGEPNPEYLPVPKGGEKCLKPSIS